MLLSDIKLVYPFEFCNKLGQDLQLEYYRDKLIKLKLR